MFTKVSQQQELADRKQKRLHFLLSRAMLSDAFFLLFIPILVSLHFSVARAEEPVVVNGVQAEKSKPPVTTDDDLCRYVRDSNQSQDMDACTGMIFSNVKNIFIVSSENVPHSVQSELFQPSNVSKLAACILKRHLQTFSNNKIVQPIQVQILPNVAFTRNPDLKKDQNLTIWIETWTDRSNLEGSNGDQVIVMLVHNYRPDSNDIRDLGYTCNVVLRNQTDRDKLLRVETESMRSCLANIYTHTTENNVK